MLKRIAIVAFFTGCGQLLSIFVLKFISQNSSVAQLKAIAEIDSLVFFIMNIVALGLQAAAMRNLAQADQWQQEYYDTQSARITLGILLMGAAVLGFINEYYLLFLIAPILAWSGDYALYARGYPVAGSMIAFVRLAIPFSAVLIAALYFPASLGWVYVVSLTAVYIATNAYISYYLKTAYVFRPSFKNLRLYISSLPLGIVAVSLYFLGLGLILIVPYLFLPEVVAIAFVGLKFYVIFKGVLRIIHQAFIKEMMRYDVCFKVDQLCSLIGLVFASFTICFPETFIRLFFGERYLADKTFFILLSLAGLIYSLFCSLTTKAMLEKRDRPYAKVSALCGLLTVALCIIFSTIWQNAFGIALSLLIGEIVFAAGMLWVMDKSTLLPERGIFLFRNLALVIIPLAISYFIGDKLTPLIVAAVLFAATLVLLYYNRFSLVFEEEKSTQRSP
jgi:O-antigen/teichoic acid export membrane protein